jgi:LDH2 family malate/lactate/ureidoglycolate dehydrogenase
MAIGISAFTDLDSFNKTAGDIMRGLRASAIAPGQSRIYTAGEKEHLAWQERKTRGIPVNAALQQQMVQMRNELKLTKYHFPFEYMSL